jgi:hypothetical protein
MKPSEYVKRNFINTYNLNNTLGGKLTLKKLNDMDKRFIDREELKDKINEIDIWNKNGLKVKKEILGLLK